jgi:hypothetical protein
VVGIAIKEVSHTDEALGWDIVRIPVTIPEGSRTNGRGYCVNITELSYEWEGSGPSVSAWTGFPFLSFKH